MIIAFFFFQAEDGIRDGRVTGVQTCALPISKRRSSFRVTKNGVSRPYAVVLTSTSRSRPDSSNERTSKPMPSRSEERRVGKEGRSRWLAEQSEEEVLTARQHERYLKSHGSAP